MPRFLKLPHSDAQTLIDLGLTSLQARVYLALVKSGPSKVATISNLSQVARPDVYRTLIKLQQLGLTEKIIEMPFHFRAVPLDECLVFLLKRKTEEYDKLKVKTKLLLRVVKEKGSEKALQTEDQQFVLIPQRKVVIKRLNEAIERAQRSIDLFLSWKRFSFGIASAFTESAGRACARGVRIRFLVQNPEDRKAAEHVIQFCRERPTCQLRFFPSRPKTVLGIYDKKEAFIIINPEMGLPDSPALWSNSQSLIAIAQDFFDISWLTGMENPDYEVNDVAVNIL